MTKVLTDITALRGEPVPSRKNTQPSQEIDTTKSIVFYMEDYPFLLERLRRHGASGLRAINNEDFEASFYLGQQECAFTRKFKNTCISTYLFKINILRKNGFNLGFLTTLPLNEIDTLHELNAVIQRDFERGNITSEQVKNMKDKLISLLEFKSNTDNSLESLPLLVWPEDKEPGEKAVDFLKRVWGRGGDKIAFHKSDIRSTNLALYQALSTYFRRYPPKGELLDWWKTSSIRSKDEIDEELRRLKIERPEDAFDRGLEAHEAHRLYNASLRRQA